MENQDDEKGVELGTGHGKGQTNEDAMEYDAELKDEDCRHLSLVVFEREWIASRFDFVVFAGMTEMIVPWDMAMRSRLSSGWWLSDRGRVVFVW